MLVAVMGVAVVLVRRLVGTRERLLVEPAPDVDRLLLGIDQAGAEQPGRIDLPCITLSILAPGLRRRRHDSNAAVSLTKSRLVISSRSASATCFTASY